MPRRPALALAALVPALVPASADACVGCQSISVANIESEENCTVYTNDWGDLLLGECRKQFPVLRDMIETALRNTNKFSLTDTARIALRVDEKTVDRIINSGGTAHRAVFKGVDFLVYGKVTEFSRGERSYSGDGVDTSSADAALAVDLKIVNIRTGRIAFQQNVREELETTGSIQTAGRSSSSAMNAARVAGLLQRAAAEAIAHEITFAAYPPRVMRAEGDRIFINYGRPFLERGQRVTLMSAGAPLIDPATGASLGQMETPNGIYRIEQVTPQMSVGRIETAGERPARTNDIVRFERGGDDEIERGTIPPL